MQTPKKRARNDATYASFCIRSPNIQIVISGFGTHNRPSLRLCAAQVGCHDEWMYYKVLPDAAVLPLGTSLDELGIHDRQIIIGVGWPQSLLHFGFHALF